MSSSKYVVGRDAEIEVDSSELVLGSGLETEVSRFSLCNVRA